MHPDFQTYRQALIYLDIAALFICLRQPPNIPRAIIRPPATTFANLINRYELLQKIAAETSEIDAETSEASDSKNLSNFNAKSERLSASLLPKLFNLIFPKHSFF